MEGINEYTVEDYEVTYGQRMMEDKIRMMRSRTWMRNFRRRAGLTISGGNGGKCHQVIAFCH